MKKFCLSAAVSFLSVFAFAQQTSFYKEPQDRFYEAKEYYQKEQYNLAYPLFKELQQTVSPSDRINNTTVAQEIDFYAIACALKQNESRSELDAQVYIDVTKNNARAQMMRFQLAEYYFRQQRFSDAVPLYESANIANLNNREVADMKFNQGY